MASAQKPVPKSTSRWNFISQAVASVESRLDTILADEEAPSRKPTPQPQASRENVPPRASIDSGKSSNPGNDRLQERLARAMVKKNVSRADSPTVSETTSRASTPVSARAPVDASNTHEDGDDATVEAVEAVIDASTEQGDKAGSDLLRTEQSDSTPSEAPKGELNVQRASKDSVHLDWANAGLSNTSEPVDAALLQAQLEHEGEKTKMQEEIAGYIERIDALNAKLQYLAKETATAAKQSTENTETGSIERQLLEKDEKIALLMEEGQKLSMTEMRHLTTIKKLRSQAVTNSKDQDAIRHRAERAERTVNVLDERIQKAEATAKITESKLIAANAKAQDLAAVTREKFALNETLIEMRAQVAKANSRAENAESMAQNEQIGIERKRIAELQDDLSSARIERELTEEKLRQEIKDLKSTLDREKEQCRAMETEMIAEQAALESKLEVFRVRAEEASSNDFGDTQAKLLRQVEALQSQYAAASQNWQGIEGTLVARISTLEKERGELSTRETELRRKSKDATSRAKKTEKEIEDLQLQYATLQEEQSTAMAESQRTNRKIQQLEEELLKVNKDSEDHKVRLERDFVRRLDEEKSRWAASVQLVSPTTSIRKASHQDAHHPSNLYTERPVSRRSSTMASALTNTDLHSPSRQHSTASLRNMNNGFPLDTPVLVTPQDQDEYFAGVPATPLSPDHTPSRRGVGDLISTSTLGAGPSVQLVERMSANVRRLESEKAASKDELIRITAQRDESRQEVVRLMREAEQKRDIELRLKALEEEHRAVNLRHQATLEMLGEKSEQVEELKADILDVKQMYRELADHMK